MASPRERLEQLRAMKAAQSQQTVQSDPRARLEQLRAMKAEQQAQEQIRLAQPTGVDPDIPIPENLAQQEQQMIAASPRAARAQQLREERAQDRFADIPEIGSGGLLSGEDSARVAAISPVLLTTTDPQEMGQILTSNFPNVGVSQTPEGRLIAVNNATGATVELNKPGFSNLDVMQGLGLAAAFAPTGRIAQAGTAGARLGAGVLARRAAQSAVGSGAIEAGLQGAQQLAGGEFNPEDVALTAGLGGAGEVAAPVVGGLARTVKAAPRRLADVADEPLQRALQQGTVLTSDVAPPTTAAGTLAQRITERLPIVGTGGIRAAQQEQREQIVEGLMDQFGVTEADDFTVNIVKSLSEFTDQAKTKGFRLRGEAIDQLEQFGDVPTPKAIQKIDDLIAEETRAGTSGDEALIGKLTDLKNEFFGDFRRIADQRTRLTGDISDFNTPGKSGQLRSGADSKLEQVRTALTQDMDDFAKTISREEGGEFRSAFNKWKSGNKLLAEEINKVTNTELRKALIKGDTTPELINTVIKRGIRSELNRLNKALTPEGRQNVQRQFLLNALNKSQRTGEINPLTFQKELIQDKGRAVVNAFFKGEDKKVLQGVQRYLQLTRRAQEAGFGPATQLEATGIGAGLGAGAVGAPAATALALTAAGLGRVFESKPVRNLVIKLSQTNAARERDAIMRELTPLIIASGQSNESVLQQPENAQ